MIFQYITNSFEISKFCHLLVTKWRKHTEVDERFDLIQRVVYAFNFPVSWNFRYPLCASLVFWKFMECESSPILWPSCRTAWYTAVGTILTWHGFIYVTWKSTYVNNSYVSRKNIENIKYQPIYFKISVTCMIEESCHLIQYKCCMFVRFRNFD